MSVAVAREQPERLLSIGQVLSVLSESFADLTPSKLRFLEEQGLVAPERTKSGYRKFSQEHIERVRLVLTLQRDHYLPLKVIADILEELDAGGDPVIPGATERSVSSMLAPTLVLSSDELCRKAGTDMRFLGQVIAAGLLPAAEVFPFECIAQLTALVRLAEQGLGPRHLRAMRIAAERDAELIERGVAARLGNAGAHAGHEAALALAEDLEAVRSGVLRRALSDI
ncbi:MerR family transcriptional regulator [Leucobacter sp. cx-328]|uniref:transcriptional regulator FtsR n=1 Tax=unclassified Leucobacter TaxID=2621730 RepID=UPI00165EBA92|nr:MerR family transcriptional regulator [Leucobacter sp. cx-328]